jgi:methionyl-tRNA formyltransferase
MRELLILGGTDISLVVADAALAAGVSLRGIVHVGQEFAISYDSKPVASSRFADVAGWCAQRNIREVLFSSYEQAFERLGVTGEEICLAAGWYHMAPRSVRARFGGRTLGLHSSLLPKLRGGAPLNWAILSGMNETGVSLFALDDGVDDGPVYAQVAIPIDERETISGLVAKSAAACRTLIEQNIGAIIDGSLQPRPQLGEASYCLQRKPEDGRIDWTRSNHEIDRLIRAVGRPYPGAGTVLDGEPLTLWAALPLHDAPLVLGAPGQLVRLPGVAEPCVVTGRGLLAIVEATGSDDSNALPLLLKSGQRRFAC